MHMSIWHWKWQTLSLGLGILDMAIDTTYLHVRLIGLKPANDLKGR
jgi:hypothetical protein